MLHLYKVSDVKVTDQIDMSACCRYSRTPIDECLGKPFQDDVMALIDACQEQDANQSSEMDQELEAADDEEANHTYIDKIGRRVQVTADFLRESMTDDA